MPLSGAAFGQSLTGESKVYALHKPGFSKLSTKLITKVRPSDEALRGKLTLAGEARAKLIT